jgi:hypothetical protein
LTVLSGLGAPAIHDYIEDARLVRARHDVATLAVSFVRLFNDVGPERARPEGWATFDLLAGAGAIPATAAPGSLWAAASDSGVVGSMDDHLVRNSGAYRSYRSTGMIGWRGPYLQKPVTADPWGHRYAVNVRALRTNGSDTFVISAGRDGVVTMPFDGDGLHDVSDDVAALVSSTGVGR